MSKFARVYTDFLTSDNAADNKKSGNFVRVLPSSVTSYFKSANGESRTSAAILGSQFACSREVAAPIDLPQSATVLTFLALLRKSTITLISSFS